jgi:tetratricopeptide (TPR) repeat protein
MPAHVSLCLIVKDEEAHLPACLGSAADLVDELIVVDTGSADRTKEIAAASGARVVDFAWVDDFSAARNAALRHATGDWVFWLDADERLDEPNGQRLRQLFTGLGDDRAAYSMKCRCLPATRTASATVVDHVRLFRRHPQLRWTYRVHEQILPALGQLGYQIRWTDVVLDHSGYQDPARHQAKQHRNLRLLRLQEADDPDEPFTLFNLGWALLELGQPADALPYLRRSLARTHPGASIVRKLYALLTQAHRQLGQPGAALAACRAGRARYPHDAELLFREGLLRRAQGDPAGAEACWQQLLAGPSPAHFASVDADLRGWKARQQLALLYRAWGRAAEAEAQWRQVLAEQPHCGPAWLGLGELCLAQGRWDELEAAAAQLGNGAGAPVEAAVLRARGHLARRAFAAARQLLEETIAQAPEAVWPRLLLTHVLLQEDRDPGAAEGALRALLERVPGQAEAWRNLAVLLARHGRAGEAAAACRAGLAHCPDEPALLLLHGHLLYQLGEVGQAEASLLRLLATQPDGPAASGAARQLLAQIDERQGRHAEAEAQWRAVRAADPDQAATRPHLQRQFRPPAGAAAG